MSLIFVYGARCGLEFFFWHMDILSPFVEKAKLFCTVALAPLLKMN